MKKIVAIATLFEIFRISSASPTSRSLQSEPCMNEVVVEDSLTFRYRVDEDENSKAFITAELVYDGVAWLGAGIPGDPIGMVGSHAVIANGFMEPALYELTMKDTSGIVPLADDLQTLFDHSIAQDDVSTTLSFSKYLEEPGHNSLKAGATNAMIYAYGFSNDFGYHQSRGMFQFDLSSTCTEEKDVMEEEEDVVEEEVTEAEEEVTGDEEDSGVDFGECGRKIVLEDGLKFSYIVEGDNDNGFHLSASLQYEGAAWLSIGIPTDPLGMVGSHAVIASGDMDPLLYELNAKDGNQIVPLTDELQTLFDHSIEQDDVSTTLTFSKLLEEPGHNPLHADKKNTILYAYGASNSWAYHKKRGFFEITLHTDCSAIPTDASEESIITFEAPNKELWRAHGILAAFAWGIATPIAILSSVFREYFPGKGLWFKSHMFFNMISILFTIAAVCIAFSSFGKSGQPHLSLPHHVIGLVIFILALVQLLNGILRPHVGGDHGVTPIRKKWQILHKCLGSAIVILSVYNIKTGLDYYSLRYSTWNWNPVYLAWIAIVAVMIAGNKLKSLMCSGNEQEAK